MGGCLGIIRLLKGRSKDRGEHLCVTSAGQGKTPLVRDHFNEHWHLVMCLIVDTGTPPSPQGRMIMTVTYPLRKKDFTGERERYGKCQQLAR